MMRTGQKVVVHIGGTLTKTKQMGYFQDAQDKPSSSRLTSFIVVISALLMAEQVLIFAYLMDSDILMAASAAGTTFVTIGGASMYFMYNQKKQESKNETK